MASTSFSTSSYLKQELQLPCGAVIKNRIVKAAMTERLANRQQQATKRLEKLYKHWSSNGAGLLITGNIMVDKRYKEASANLVLENENAVSSLSEMVRAGTANNTHLWAQISHAGRQSTIFSTFKPIAPSAIQLKKLFLFAKPKAMTMEQINDVEDRFEKTAVLCQKAGFTGIQVHAAHGYLINQFLSPLTNKRTDEYGGTIENRARLLINIINRLRKRLGDSFPISVKLNSADFQRGGFDEDDAMYVIRILERLGIDLLEISGGTYENVVFFERLKQRESTRQREAYFIDFAKKIKAQTALPIMVTGGFRSRSFCEQVLKNIELDLIGFARPFLNEENFPKNFLKTSESRVKDATFDFKIKKMKDFAEAGFYDYQIHRLAKGKSLKPDYNPYKAVVRMTTNELLKGWF
ncbi:NADH:flavin oxidoreductase/NADH oxidase family protein [Aquimarina sp. 2-A2]|uniref:NADH:flavin oxidoreductase/NADH oxidase family protein n=1 Tax=Aquimarina sp. 2-A2 TaxID=3382644 RepID=UPI00387F1CEF